MSENLSFKKTISQEIEEYLNLVWQQEREKEKTVKEENFLKPEESLGKVARFYEEIRNSLEVREEHLLRQYAIARILRREIVLEEKKENIARELLLELIRGGYLSEKEILESDIPEFEKIIKKYSYLIEKIPFLEKKKEFDWWLSLAAAEIEKKLSYQFYQREKILVRIIFKRLSEVIDLKEINLEEKQKKGLFYLAILKGIFKYDSVILRERLFAFYFPKWEEMDDLSFLERKNLKEIAFFIEKQIKSPYLNKILPLVKRYFLLFHLFIDSVEEAVLLAENKEDFLNIFKEEDRMDSLLERNYWRRIRKTKEKVKRLIFRSVIFLLLTKTILAIIFEYPYETYFLKQKNYFPLLTNIFFHPLLLILISSSFKFTIKQKNLILQGEKELLFETEKEEIISKEKVPKIKGAKIEGTLDFLWFASFFVVFSLIIYFLKILKFNFVSIIFFLLFLTLVSYLGWRARNIVKENIILKEKNGFLGIVLSFFALPIIKVGEFLVRKLPNFNVIVFLMDFIIEVPFKAIIRGLEEWFSFTRKKREEIET